MAASRRKPIHQQPKLCDHILSHAAKSDVSLRISESSIPNAGSGLFAVNDIPAGSEIFHTNPLITVAESALQGICDFCFLNSGTSVNRNGRFYGSAEDDVRPEITRCGACMVARYCSKVSAVKLSGSHLLIMSSCVARNVRPRRGRATTNTNAASYKRTQPWDPWTKPCVDCSSGLSIEPSQKMTCVSLWHWRRSSRPIWSACADRVRRHLRSTSLFKLRTIYTPISTRASV